MKNNLFICWSCCLFAGLLCLAGCENETYTKKSLSVEGPRLTFPDETSVYENLNAGDRVSIPFRAESGMGIKAIAYYFTVATENGTETTEPDTLAVPDPMQPAVDTVLEFPVEPDYRDVNIVAYDGRYNSSQQTISFLHIRSKPVVGFADGIDYKEAVFEGKALEVAGDIASEYELVRLTCTPIVSGQPLAAQETGVEGKKNTAFRFAVPVVKGLEEVHIEVENIYHGITRDTFRIGSVLDDNIVVALTGNLAELTGLFEGEENTVAGTVSSGSDLVSLEYALKVNGLYEASMPVDLGAAADEFSFSLPVYGKPGLEALRIVARNAGGKQTEKVFPVAEMESRLVYLQDVVMTTEIGPGKMCWFSCYEEPHLFDRSTAAGLSERMDFVFALHGGRKLSILSPNIVDVAGYDVTLQPYMEGFSYVTYLVVTANRAQVKPAAFQALVTEKQLDAFIEEQVIGAGKYGLKTTNRGLNTGLTVNAGFVIGWGAQSDKSVKPLVVENKQFGLILVKELNLSGGVGTIRFDIKYPRRDARAACNPESGRPYQPSK